LIFNRLKFPRGIADPTFVFGVTGYDANVSLDSRHPLGIYIKNPYSDAIWQLFREILNKRFAVSPGSNYPEDIIFGSFDSKVNLQLARYGYVPFCVAQKITVVIFTDLYFQIKPSIQVISPIIIGMQILELPSERPVSEIGVELTNQEDLLSEIDIHRANHNLPKATLRRNYQLTSPKQSKTL
jgi:hypothetical protein